MVDTIFGSGMLLYKFLPLFICTHRTYFKGFYFYILTFGCKGKFSDFLSKCMREN